MPHYRDRYYLELAVERVSEAMQDSYSGVACLVLFLIELSGATDGKRGSDGLQSRANQARDHPDADIAV